MRPIIIIFGLTLLIIAGGCLTLYSLNFESQRLDQSLTALEQDIKEQDWDEALKKLKEFNTEWDKVSTFWSMLIDHYEIDNIELILSQLTSYVKSQEKTEALSQMSSLKTLIKHIPEKESFNLRNIF